MSPNATRTGRRNHAEGVTRPAERRLRWFVQAVVEEAPIDLFPSETWTDDLWFLDQRDRVVWPNEGWWALQPGTGEGRLVGGNLCTLNLLQGTSYMPSLDGAVLMVEDDAETNPVTFARDLTSLLQLPDAAGIQGLVIGRFQRASCMTRALLTQIIARQQRLAALPVLANVDFGHTNPMATLPIGGREALAVGKTTTLTVSDH